MRISVVIASYNRCEALADCLATLLDQDLPCDQYEIVVVVDGSSDGTSEMLRSFRALGNFVIVEQENKGQTAALNAGVNAASGELVLFLDDDLLCDRSLISSHLAAHECSAPAVVIGRMLSVMGPSPSLGERLMHDNLEQYHSRLMSDLSLRWPDDAWAGPNCSIPRAVFLEAGGYDAKLFPRRREDVDLGLRIWKMGIAFRYESRAITSHRTVKSNRQFWADVIEDGASIVRLCRKHPAMRSHSPLAGILSTSRLKQFGAKVVSGQPAAARVSLDILIAVFDKASWLPSGHQVALRLFGIKQGVAILAGARREVGSWRLLTEQFGKRFAVLLYHHIGIPTAETKRFSITVSKARFRRHVRWLRWRGYETITPAQWLAWFCTGERLPEKPLLITFDDGFADVAENALPLLEENGFRSTVFVITKPKGDSNTWETLPLMTQSQTLDWSTRGVEIGAHARTHTDLPTLSDECIANEVIGSKDDLTRAGLMPMSFAYPYGSFDSRVRKLVDGVFQLAFTCEEGLNDLLTDPLLLKRTMVHPGDTILDLELRAALGWSPLHLIRSRLRIRSRALRVLRYMLPSS